MMYWLVMIIHWRTPTEELVKLAKLNKISDSGKSRRLGHQGSERTHNGIRYASNLDRMHWVLVITRVV